MYWSALTFVRDRKFVEAIDFGTCNAKMAFAFNPLAPGGETQIVVMDAWENAPGAVMAPTTILIDPTTILDVAKAKISFLFKNFKMALHQKEVGKNCFSCTRVII